MRPPLATLERILREDNPRKNLWLAAFFLGFAAYLAAHIIYALRGL
jgi:hypothetical protein